MKNLPQMKENGRNVFGRHGLRASVEEVPRDLHQGPTGDHEVEAPVALRESRPHGADVDQIQARHDLQERP